MIKKKKEIMQKINRHDFLKRAAACATAAVMGMFGISCDDSAEFTYQGNLDVITLNSNVSSTISLLAGKTIESPYNGVNWDSYNQYKSALHTHSTRSDGANTLAQMIEEKYRQDYDIVAMTDHNIVNYSWTTGLGRLDEERYNMMVSGTAPKIKLDGTFETIPRGRGILRLNHTNEQSRTDHINSFWADWNNASGATMQTTLQSIQDANGIANVDVVLTNIKRPYRVLLEQQGFTVVKNSSVNSF